MGTYFCFKFKFYLKLLLLSLLISKLYYLYLECNGYNFNNFSNNIISEQLPIILLVTYRDTLLGCGNFHLYLRKEFVETIFCLPDNYIKLSNINELINNTSATYNIHVIKHQQLKGEMWCRAKALNYLINTNKNTDYLLSWNCEISPFDINYKQNNALPFIDMIEKLIYTYKYELNRRSNRIQSLPMPYNSIIPNNSPDRSFYDLFAIIPSLWENWYETDQLGNKKTNIRFHGDNAKQLWSHDHFIVKDGYINNSIPWLHDTLYFVEAHVVMYNISLLNKYKNIYFINNYTSWTSEPLNIQRLFNQYNINATIVRTNDVNIPINFGNDNIKYIDNINKYNIKPITQLHWELISYVRSPKGCFDHWYIPYQSLKQHRIENYCQCFIQFNWSKLWISNFETKHLNYLFKLLGYDLIHNSNDYYTFKMKNIYPHSIYVSDKNTKRSNGNLFLRYYDKNKKETISIYSFPWHRKEGRHNYQHRFKQLNNLHDLNKTEIKINKNITIIEIKSPTGRRCQTTMFNQHNMIQFAKSKQYI
eukprot:435777_1